MPKKMPPRKKLSVVIKPKGSKAKKPTKPVDSSSSGSESPRASADDDATSTQRAAEITAEITPAAACGTATDHATEADIPNLPKKRKKNKAVNLSEEQEVELGEWLRNHPQFYTKSLKAYKDVGKKRSLWDDKAAELKMESGDLLHTWYESIRTRIGKMLKDKSGSAARDLTERENFLKENFGFLGDHIARVRGRTAFSLQSNIESCSVARSRSRSTSSSEMDDVNTPHVGPSSPEGPQALKLSTEQQAPTKTHTRGKATKKSGGAPSSTTNSTTGDQIEEQEVATIIQSLQNQGTRNEQLQGQICNILGDDRSSTSASWGAFMGNLSQRIDDRLLSAFYRESLDHVLGYIDRSRALSVQQPILPPPPPLPQYDYVQQQQQQQQQQPQQQQTFTSLIPAAPGTAQQQHSGGFTYMDPGISQPSTSTWDTFVPTAGQPIVQSTPSQDTASSAPNLSQGSMTRLSDLSALMAQSPGDNVLSASRNLDTPTHFTTKSP